MFVFCVFWIDGKGEKWGRGAIFVAAFTSVCKRDVNLVFAPMVMVVEVMVMMLE